jgi:hypothetical protein
MRRLILVLLLTFPNIIYGAEQNTFILSDGVSTVTASVQQTGTTVLDIEIGNLNYELIGTSGSELKISLPEEFSQSRGAYMGPGTAILPTITRLIAVPFDSDPSFKVVSSNFITLDNITLAPADSEELASYQSSTVELGPDLLPELVIGQDAGIFRDLRLYSLTISPVQYDTTKHTLRVCREVEIEISHPGSQVAFYGNHLSETFLPVYRSLVDNPLVFDPIAATRGAYWIIYADVFETNIQPLADWKKAKGFDVVKISRTQLGANNYTNIKNYILARFDSCLIKPDYIVIVGDVAMPNNVGIATRAYANPLDYGNIDSDNFYTFLHGNDYFPEVLIGRISVDNTSELSSYFAKLFKYERNPYMNNTAWYRRATIVAGSDGYSLFSTRLTKLWCRETMMDHGFTQVDTFFTTYSGGVTPEEINSSINNGVAYVNYRGYGTADGWVPPTYTSSNVMQLVNTNMYPIMTSVVCATGDFNDTDTGVDVCFGETWIRAANKGGAGFIGNSNHYAHTKWTNAIDVGIYWGLFTEGVNTLAQAELMGKMTLYNAFPFNRAAGGQVELYFNSYNLLGDPEINCWTGIPQPMTVTHPDTIPLGQNRVDIHVQSAGGFPLEGAVVCIWKQNEIFASGFTGSDGNYEFQESALTAGEMRVTTILRGHIPVEDTIMYMASPLAVGYSSHTIDDDANGESLGDGDGIINPSERVELRINLANFGLSDTAYGVTAGIASEIPGISVIRAAAYYGTIMPESSVASSQPFIVTATSDIPNGTVAPFLIEIADTLGHHWHGVVRTTVQAAQISFDSVVVALDDNGQIDPGEVFGLIIYARNIGAKPLLNPTATLRCIDSHIQIVDSVVTLSSIIPGTVSNNDSHPFMAAIDNEVFVGHQLNFVAEFDGQGPQMISASFSKTVGTITSHDPIGPDNYGYYCFDNTDSAYANRPTYNWINIDTSWPSVSLSDDDVATIGLPFPVKYYGQNYDSITICDNGFVAMGTTWFPNFFNAPIPAPQDAKAMIAPFWDDFTQDPLLVYYYHDLPNAQFIIGWKNALDGDVGRNQTFEIIFLDETIWPTRTDDNDIIFQYNLVQRPESSSVGICSPDRRDGIGYLFNTSYNPGAAQLITGRAIKFTTGSLYSTVAEQSSMPGSFELSQNYPNPFNAATSIEFNVPVVEHVTLDIYNVMGQKIETLADGDFAVGRHSVVWNAGDKSSGFYFYRLKMGEKVVSRRMTLLK